MYDKNNLSLCSYLVEMEISKSRIFLVLEGELLVNRLKFLYYWAHIFFSKKLLDSFNSSTDQTELKEIQS